MANELSSIPWSFDTITADPVASAHYTGHVVIRSIVFTNYDADTDTFELKDINGRIVAAGNGTDDLAPVHLQLDTSCQGLSLTDLTSGQVYVYIA